MSPVQSLQLINPLNLILLCFVVLLIVFMVFRIRKDLQFKKELNFVEEEIEIAYQRLESIFSVNQSFIDAADENEIVDQVLEILLGLVGMECHLDLIINVRMKKIILFLN